jgi:hypothetical protein
MVSINTETELPLSDMPPLWFLKLLMLNRELEGIQLQTKSATVETGATVSKCSFIHK